MGLKCFKEGVLPDVKHAAVIHRRHVLVFLASAKAAQLAIYAQACPSIDGSIPLLTFVESGCLPVGESLALGNTFAKEVGINLLQTHVNDAHFLYHLLEFHYARYPYMAALIEGTYVVMQRQAYLRLATIGQKGSQTVRYADAIQAKEETCVVSRDLQQGNFMTLVAAEVGASLRVNTHELKRLQIGSSLVAFTHSGDGDDSAVKTLKRHLIHQPFIYLRIYLPHGRLFVSVIHLLVQDIVECSHYIHTFLPPVLLEVVEHLP